MELRILRFNFLTLTVIFYIIMIAIADESEDLRKARRVGKDVRDMTDAELEMILDQWEEDEEPLEPDELPEHLRPQAKIDMSQVNFKDPDSVLKLTKKGKSLMMFVDVNPELSETQAADILSIWQSSLQNSHIVAERYPIESKRAIFMFRDGAQAVDAKNFFLEQPECSHVTLEGQNYIGKHASETAKQTVEQINVKTRPQSKVEKMDKTEL